MYGYGQLPETQEEWKALFAKMYGVMGTVTGLDSIPIGLPGLHTSAKSVEGKQARELAEAYGPIAEDVDYSAIEADKERYMDTKPQSYVPKITKDEPDKEDNLMQQAFLMSLMENMGGGDIGQAPGVVAGGGQRPFPTMMGQISPWEQQKPYWWIR